MFPHNSDPALFFAGTVGPPFLLQPSDNPHSRAFMPKVVATVRHRASAFNAETTPFFFQLAILFGRPAGYQLKSTDMSTFRSYPKQRFPFQNPFNQDTV
jgi:hypothetical protein